jgi:transcriptional regulator with XRE-family HTH domain
MSKIKVVGDDIVILNGMNILSSGDKIKLLRDLSKLSQIELSKKAGVSLDAVEGIENFFSEAAIGDVQKVAKFFNVDITTILTEIPDTETEYRVAVYFYDDNDPSEIEFSAPDYEEVLKQLIEYMKTTDQTPKITKSQLVQIEKDIRKHFEIRDFDERGLTIPSQVGKKNNAVEVDFTLRIDENPVASKRNPVNEDSEIRITVLAKNKDFKENIEIDGLSFTDTFAQLVDKIERYFALSPDKETELYNILAKAYEFGKQKAVMHETKAKMNPLEESNIHHVSDEVISFEIMTMKATKVKLRSPKKQEPEFEYKIYASCEEANFNQLYENTDYFVCLDRLCEDVGKRICKISDELEEEIRDFTVRGFNENNKKKVRLEEDFNLYDECLDEDYELHIKLVKVSMTPAKPPKKQELRFNYRIFAEIEDINFNNFYEESDYTLAIDGLIIDIDARIDGFTKKESKRIRDFIADTFKNDDVLKVERKKKFKLNENDGDFKLSIELSKVRITPEDEG